MAFSDVEPLAASCLVSIQYLGAAGLLIARIAFSAEFIKKTVRI